MNDDLPKLSRSLPLPAATGRPNRAAAALAARSRSGAGLWRPRSFAARLAIFCIFCPLALPLSVAACQESVGKDKIPAGAADSEALPDFGPIQAKLEAIRGLRFTRPVPASFQDAGDFAAMVDEELAEMLPAERQDGMVKGLVRLGLLAEPIDIAEALRTTYATQALAYYDPEADRFFYLARGLGEAEMEDVTAHELVHALQDQVFDLGPIGDLQESLVARDVRQEDFALAIGFLIEGEATYVENRYAMDRDGMSFAGIPSAERMYFKNAARLEDSFSAMFSGKDMGDLEGVDEMIASALRGMADLPPLLIRPLQAQYGFGAYFVMSAVHEGGFDAVSAIYEDLPRSTEQVLHPEKYFREPDEPTPLPLLSPSLLEAEGWTRIDAAVHGELHLALLLELNGCPRLNAEAAAAGWDGDVYQAFWHPEKKHTMTVLQTTWDDDTEALRFFEAYHDTFRTKYPKRAGSASGPGNASGAGDESGSLVSFDSGDPALGQVWLERKGREVFAIEGGDPGLAVELAGALRALEVRHVR